VAVWVGGAVRDGVVFGGVASRVGGEFAGVYRFVFGLVLVGLRLAVLGFCGIRFGFRGSGSDPAVSALEPTPRSDNNLPDRLVGTHLPARWPPLRVVVPVTTR
jgi:hypothetical protein